MQSEQDMQNIFPPKVGINNFDIRINGHNDFHEPVKNEIRTYDNIRKNTTGQGMTIQLVASLIMHTY